MSKFELLEIAARDIPYEELDAALTAGYGLLSGPARHLARLIFAPERARWVADETWHPDQSVKWLADRSVSIDSDISPPVEWPHWCGQESLRHHRRNLYGEDGLVGGQALPLRALGQHQVIGQSYDSIAQEVDQGPGRASDARARYRSKCPSVRLSYWIRPLPRTYVTSVSLTHRRFCTVIANRNNLTTQCQ
ncbi:hypothetical protein [Candidatus Rariloculus sp.]|uniref:hypothetical protein n=1 Tax=Candidatus Rariloculus sp. TaxID=3101265 RepID=UPI003D0B07AC